MKELIQPILIDSCEMNYLPRGVKYFSVSIDMMNMETSNFSTYFSIWILSILLHWGGTWWLSNLIPFGIIFRYLEGQLNKDLCYVLIMTIKYYYDISEPN